MLNSADVHFKKRMIRQMLAAFNLFLASLIQVIFSEGIAIRQVVDEKKVLDGLINTLKKGNMGNGR